MHFDNDAVGADGDSRARGGRHQASASRGVRRIDHHRQVAKLLAKRDACKIQRVPQFGVKRLDSRSHSTTLGFPPDSKYSAANSHSLIVAEGPRFSSTGRDTVASRRNSG